MRAGVPRGAVAHRARVQDAPQRLAEHPRAVQRLPGRRRVGGGQGAQPRGFIAGNHVRAGAPRQQVIVALEPVLIGLVAQPVIHRVQKIEARQPADAR